MIISNRTKPNSKIKCILLYQISRDGDNISTFYNKVNNKVPFWLCKTIVKTEENIIDIYSRYYRPP